MLRIIFWTIIIILILSFFGISLQSVATSPLAQQNFGFADQILLQIWNVVLNIFNAAYIPVLAFINSLIYHKPIYGSL